MKYPVTLTEWFTTLTNASQGGTFVRIAITKPTPSAGDLKSIDIRPIMVKRELKLSFTYHHKTKDIVKNHGLDESLPILAKLMNQSFTAARLHTTVIDHLLATNGKTFTIVTQKATNTQAPSLSHDKPKTRLIEAPTKPYLQSLGLTDSQGEVLKSSQDKFRQINKYIEILDGLLKQFPDKKEWRVADMGSGKGYLTFALYDHLTTTMGLKAHVTGVEYRDDMVTLCNAIAKENAFTDLTFIQGTIADYDCKGTDLVIALHACDTATDDALAKAIKANAALIVVAPCCHKQVRRNMKPAASHPLAAMLRFGTYTERMAEMLTDTLRTQILETVGYTPNLFEFIDGEHTPKNVMIVATRNTQPHTPEFQSKLNASVQATKAHFNLPKHHLETLLGH